MSRMYNPDGGGSAGDRRCRQRVKIPQVKVVRLFEKPRKTLVISRVEIRIGKPTGARITLSLKTDSTVTSRFYGKCANHVANVTAAALSSD